jgi:hypothetical protein
VLTGAVAGVVSTYGFSFLSPPLKRWGLTDSECRGREARRPSIGSTSAVLEAAASAFVRA